MTKAKAKTLVTELIERGFAPTISESNGDYTIRIVGVEVATTGVQQVENALNVTATVRAVEFN